jgi:hypothetical protein
MPDSIPRMPDLSVCENQGKELSGVQDQKRSGEETSFQAICQTRRLPVIPLSVPAEGTALRERRDLRVFKGQLPEVPAA